MVTGRPEKWPFIHSEAVLTTCSISSSADGIEAFAWSTQKSVDDSVHVFCAFLKDLCRLLLHCDSSAESCAPSRTDSPGGTGKGGRLALHFVTSRKSWTHHTRLHWPHRTWWPLALLPAAVREPQAFHRGVTESLLHATRCPVRALGVAGNARGGALLYSTPAPAVPREKAPGGLSTRCKLLFT